MDKLITIHDEYLSKIMQLCLLDSKSRNFQDLVSSLLQLGLDFRSLCKKYFLHSETKADSDDSEDELQQNTNLFNIDSIDFVENYLKCRQEFQLIVNKHRNKMILLTAGLKKHTKTGVLNYLNEAYIRFNYNNYYVKEHEEE